MIEGLDVWDMAAVPQEAPFRAQAIRGLASAFYWNRIVVSVNHQGREPELTERGPNVVIAKTFPDLPLGSLRDPERGQLTDS